MAAEIVISMNQLPRVLGLPNDVQFFGASIVGDELHLWAQSSGLFEGKDGTRTTLNAALDLAGERVQRFARVLAQADLMSESKEMPLYEEMARRLIACGVIPPETLTA